MCPLGVFVLWLQKMLMFSGKHTKNGFLLFSRRFVLWYIGLLWEKHSLKILLEELNQSRTKALQKSFFSILIMKFMINIDTNKEALNIDHRRELWNTAKKFIDLLINVSLSLYWYFIDLRPRNKSYFPKWETFHDVKLR